MNGPFHYRAAQRLLNSDSNDWSEETLRCVVIRYEAAHLEDHRG